MSQYAHRATSEIYWQKAKKDDGLSHLEAPLSHRLLNMNGDPSEHSQSVSVYHRSYPAWKWPWLCIRPSRGASRFRFLHRGHARTIYTILFWIGLLTMYITTSSSIQASINSLPSPKAPHGEQFSEARALVDVQRLVELAQEHRAVNNFTGRYYGTDLGKDYIVGQLRAIKAGVGRPTGNWSIPLSIDVQADAKGALNYGDPKTVKSAPYVIAYQHLTNVIGILEGDKPEAICINAHYDSVLFSPGASDNAAAVGVALEVMRVLSYRKSRKYSFLALFNGAEEAGLLGAHAFVTRHRWAQRCRAMINLDSAGGWGKEILFQTTTHSPWILKAYKKGAKHPLASVIAQDLFQTGIIPSGTDFQIFNDYTDYAVLDMAHYTNGYTYHTDLDSTSYHNTTTYVSGTLQNTGDNVMGIVEALDDIPFKKPKRGTKSAVFYDWFGKHMIAYSANTARIIRSLIASTALLTALVVTLPYILQHGAGVVMMDHIVPSLVCLVFCCLTVGLSAGFGVIAAFIYHAIKPLAYFRSWSLAFFLYTPPALLGQFLAQIAIWRILRQWKLGSRDDDLSIGSNGGGHQASLYGAINDEINPEYDEEEDAQVNWCIRAHRRAAGDTQIGWRLYWGGILFWTVILLATTMNDVGAGFLAVFWIAMPLLGIGAGFTIRWALRHWEYNAQTSHHDDPNHRPLATKIQSIVCDPRDGIPWFIVFLIANVLPLAITLWTAQPLLVMFTPITGRMGLTNAVPDVLIGALVGLTLGLLMVYMWPFIHRAGNRWKMTGVMFLLSLVCLVIVSASTPWDDTHPMRVDVIHGWRATNSAPINMSLTSVMTPFSYNIDSTNEAFLSIGAPNPGDVGKIASDLSGRHPFGINPTLCSVPAYRYKLKTVPCMTMENGEPVPLPTVQLPTIDVSNSTYNAYDMTWTITLTVTAPQALMWQLFITGDLQEWSFPYPPSHANAYSDFEGLDGRYLVVLRAGAAGAYTMTFVFNVPADQTPVVFELWGNIIKQTDIMGVLLSRMPSYTQRWGKSNNVGPVLTMSKWQLYFDVDQV